LPLHPSVRLEKSPPFTPPTLTREIASGAVPLLVSVTVFASLDVLTSCDPKSTLAWLSDAALALG
jgi:hypothetical protein